MNMHGKLIKVLNINQIRYQTGFWNNFENIKSGLQNTKNLIYVKSGPGPDDVIQGQNFTHGFIS